MTEPTLCNLIHAYCDVLNRQHYANLALLSHRAARDSKAEPAEYERALKRVSEIMEESK